MSFELLQKQLLDIAWEKGYLNTVDHYDMLTDFTKLSRKNISDYRRKKCLNCGGFPAPKPKEPHVPKKFDDMCRKYLKLAWELGYLPGKKHYGLLADFSGLSRKQISDWSRKYSIKLGLKGRKASRNKRRLAPMNKMYHSKNMAKRRRFDAKPKIPKLEFKMEDLFGLTSGGLVTSEEENNPQFSSKHETDWRYDDDDFFRIKSELQIPSYSRAEIERFYFDLISPGPFKLKLDNFSSFSTMSHRFSNFPNISPPPSPQNEWDFEQINSDTPSFWAPAERMAKPSEDDLWIPGDDFEFVGCN